MPGGTFGEKVEKAQAAAVPDSAVDVKLKQHVSPTVHALMTTTELLDTRLRRKATPQQQ